MKCHWCGASIPNGAKICPHCRARLKRGVIRCPYCKEKIRAGLNLCPYCGYELGRRRLSTWLVVGVSGAVVAIAALALFFLPLNLPSFSLPTIVSPTPTEVSPPPMATPEPSIPTPTRRLIAPTPTLTSTPTPTSTSSPTSTPTPLASIPTATPAPPPTSTPTPTEILSFKYQAPRLIIPVDQAEFRGINTEIWLEWEPVGTLAQDEWYAISVRFVGREGQVVYRGDRVRKITWRVPEEYHDIASLTERAFEWDITVQREIINPDGSVGGIPLSPTSETWVFYWR